MDTRLSLRRLRLAFSAALFLFALPACATTAKKPPAPPAKLCYAKPTPELMPAWQAKDAQRVAKAFAKDALSRPWIAALTKARGRKPIVRFYPLKNRTAQHIDIAALGKQIEQALVASAKLTVLAGVDTRHRARRERRLGGGAPGGELGADLVIGGTFLSQDDVNKADVVRMWIISVEATLIDQQRKVWMKVVRVKKTTKLPKVVCPSSRPAASTATKPAATPASATSK
jgi:hypothetical protein